MSTDKKHFYGHCLFRGGGGGLYPCPVGLVKWVNFLSVLEVPVWHDMSTHVFLAGLRHQVCPPALLFRLGSRKVRRYKNTWIRNSSDAMAQQEWKVVRRRRSSEGACSTSPIFPLSPPFQTCLPPPWQERPPRARTSPPGGWSSPARRTCQQVCNIEE